MQVEAYEQGRRAGGLESSHHHAHILSRQPTRGLRSGSTVEKVASVVTVVTTGEEFMFAVSAGAEHIELQEHIILQNVDAEPWTHLELPTSVKSIRVRASMYLRSWQFGSVIQTLPSCITELDD